MGDDDDDDNDVPRSKARRLNRSKSKGKGKSKAKGGGSSKYQSRAIKSSQRQLEQMRERQRVIERENEAQKRQLRTQAREAKRVAVWGHVDWKAQRGDVQPPAGCVATPHIMKHVDPFCCSRVVTSPSSRHTAVIQQLVSLAFPLFFPLSLINPGLLWFLMQCLSATAFPAP